jgi:hypothetical protein
VCGFNRPDLLANCLVHVRAVNPPRLYISINGPREGTAQDVEPVKECLSIANEQKQWGDVFVRLGENNQGPSSGLEGGIDWTLTNEDRVLVLEDDLMAQPAFFRFCDEALNKFEHDSRFGAVCGWTPLKTPPTNPPTPIWGKYAWTWGWGVYKEVWSLYRSNTDLLSLIKDNLGDSLLLQRSHSRLAEHYWRRKISLLRYYNLDAWDFKFNMTLWQHHLLVVQPPFPLVENVGFDTRATNLKTPPSFMKGLKTQARSTDLNMDSTQEIDVDSSQEHDMWNLPTRFSLKKYVSIWISYWILKNPRRTRWYRKTQQWLSRS